MNSDGAAVEEWTESLDLSVLHDLKLPLSFNSCKWSRGYNPDLSYKSSNISPLCPKLVCAPIPTTQHRPIMCLVYAAVTPIQVPFKRRFNMSKANWNPFSELIDINLGAIDLTPISNNYERS